MSLENVNVAGHQVLVTPEQLKGRLPASEAARVNVERARGDINRILTHDDHRLLELVLGRGVLDGEARAVQDGRAERLAAGGSVWLGVEGTQGLDQLGRGAQRDVPRRRVVPVAGVDEHQDALFPLGHAVEG